MMLLRQRWQKLSPQQRVATVASAAAVTLWIAVAVVPSVEPEGVDGRAAASQPAAERVLQPARPAKTERAQPLRRAPAAPAERAQPRRPAPAVQAEDVALAPESRPPAPSVLAGLRRGLAAENSGTRIEALRAVAQTHDASVLPELLALDVARDPEVAPTLVQVTAQLAQRAPTAERDAAAAQLTRWLRAEIARDATDARANVSVLVEALGTLPSAAAATGLIEVLDNEQLSLHLQTLAVQGLARLATPAAREALQQFRARVSGMEREGFERELQHEAEQATDRALARLSR